jgi:hypothetical protein
LRNEKTDLFKAKTRNGSELHMDKEDLIIRAVTYDKDPETHNNYIDFVGGPETGLAKAYIRSIKETGSGHKGKGKKTFNQ